MDDPDPIRDELAVRNLIARLANVADVGTLEEYLALFTVDSVLEMQGMPTQEGIDGLRSGVVAARGSGAFGPGSGTIHFLGASEIHVDGSEASGHTPFVFLRGPAISLVGRYHDRFRRTDDGWRFAHHRIELG